MVPNNSNINEEYYVYIIGRKGLNNELLLTYLSQSPSPIFRCSLLSSFSMLETEKTPGIKKLVLCNCGDVQEQNPINTCQRHMTNAPSDCYWACFNVPLGTKIEENAISHGVHGVFYESDSLTTLKRGIIAILQGELWFSRDTLSATLTNLVEEKKTYKSSQSVTDRIRLTKREKEILKYVALGKTNEEIAEKLHISILTVKTHVRNIYNKINVPNRIQAIFWVTKNYLHLK
jgi:LuxR family transcriptional regulator of csgAB operon